MVGTLKNEEVEVRGVGEKNKKKRINSNK